MVEMFVLNVKEKIRLTKNYKYGIMYTSCPVTQR